MNIFLGNITFDQVEEKLGYKLNETDKVLWDKYHSNKADLSDKENCFHVFDIPRVVHFKGDEAMIAILKMFTKDKMVKAVGEIPVCKVTDKKEEEQNEKS